MERTLLIIGLLVPSISAQAAFPGQNGRIVFTSARDGNPEIYSINPDGTGLTRLTNDPAYDSVPVWSPDGKRIAFSSDRDAGQFDVYIMNADGTNDFNVTASLPNYSSCVNPTWSPDGTQIAFEYYYGSLPEIYVINVDGTNPRNITNDLGFDGEPAWSPDGERIAFVHGPSGVFIREIYVMHPDGSDVTNITQTPTSLNRTPAWSPDGKRIVFARGPNDAAYNVCMMNADGSSQTQLTNVPGFEPAPAMSPDGTKIVFVGTYIGDGGLSTMNSDGSSVTGLFYGFFPDWQPIPSMLRTGVDLDPDAINLRSHASWLTAYIEPSGFDPVTIDILTLRLAGSVPAVSKFARVGDHNRNGIPDLMVKFSRSALDPLLTLGMNSLELTGSLVTGESFAGAGEVRVIDNGLGHAGASVAPNPFNPSGTLSFNTVRPGRVAVRMFDLQGRLVRTLMEVPLMPPGKHEVQIDGRGLRGEVLQSGVYYYQVDSPDGTVTGRFAILK